MIKASEAAPTVDPRETEHFARLAEDWWNPNGSSAMLHKLNPVRLAYIRDQVDHHWGGDECALRPLEGKTAADVGCGAGLLSEPLARLGARVTAVDPVAETIEVARAHALGQGLEIDYRTGGVEALAAPGPGGSPQQFDLIASLEVIEHSADPRGFVAGLVAALAKDGLLILSTPNRTSQSRLMMIVIGEGSGRIPRGTHDWDKFLTPDELSAMLREAGLDVLDCTGLAWSPGRGFHLSDSKSLDYFVTARRA